MRAPEYWRHGGPAAAALAPVGALVAVLGGWRRRLAKSQAASVPVVCVGNLVAGGAGKTPVALAVAERVRSLGANPHFLSRGYGGRLAGPVRVEPERHGAADVGDEPLLLAAAGPTWVARDRVAGAARAVEAGAGLIVMDDGHQNARLAKDLSLVVVDAGYGFGNGRVMPAGPLREPVAAGLARASAVVLVGEEDLRLDSPVPVLRAWLRPEDNALAGCRVLAFAGIGRPEKFFATLRRLGAEVVAEIPFPDHHPYKTGEIAALRERAAALEAILVTTAKDAARLAPRHRALVTVLPVRLDFADPQALDGLLTPLLR